ncbi:hypothetical protein Tco_0675520 [Tanacetum coccineum]
MNLVVAQQVALDNALVAPEKRLKIEKCKARIKFIKPQREANYQIFLILPNQDFVKPPSEDEMVPFIQELGYSSKCDMLSAIHTDQMHLPWRTFAAIMNRINIHNVRDDTLLGTLKFVSKTKDYQKYGALIHDEMINQDIKDSKAYKTYLDFTTRKATPKKARKFKKVASTSKKLSLVLEEEPVVKPKQAKKPAKKSTTMPTTSVVIRYTPGMFVSKKKAPTRLIEAKAWIYFLKQHYLKLLSSRKLSRKASWKLISFMQVAQSNDDDSNDDDSDDDDEEYEELYKDVNARLKDAEHDEEGKGDAKMTDVGRDDGTQKTTYEQIKDDEHVILTAVHNTQNIKVLLQSSYVSSDFASQILNLDNIPPTDIEVISMMNVKVRHKEPITQTPSLLNTPVTVILKTSSAVVPTIPLKIPPIVTPLKMCRIGNMSGSVTS